MTFVHLHLHTPFSFLDGAARVEDLVEAAARLGMPALAMTDHDNVSAAVRFHKACLAAGIKPIVGAEVTVGGGEPPTALRVTPADGKGQWDGQLARQCGGNHLADRLAAGPTAQGPPSGERDRARHHVTLLARNPRGYANLCRILTDAHLSQPRLHPATTLEVLRRHAGDLICLSGCRRGAVPALLLQDRHAEARREALALRDAFGADSFFLELQSVGLPGTRQLNRRLAALAAEIGVGIVATNNVHHLRRADFAAHDVLTCARTLTKLDDVHPERRLNAQCYLRSAERMDERFAEYPRAVEAAGEIAERCTPALQPGHYHLPAYPAPAGETAHHMLCRLVWEGAQRRYGRLRREARRRIEHELAVISKLQFEDYFLVVWDLLRWARGQGVRYAGRGSAADSAVAYCLGIANVDPIARGLLFERFLSLERAVMPDIDVDFQAERRDEVMEYVVSQYGAEHVAAVATYNTFLARSAVRDLGKALGLPPADVDRLARYLPWVPADGIEAALERAPELRDGGLDRGRYGRLLELCRGVAGFPRHLSTHLGGLVITREPLVEVSPLQMAAKGCRVMQFDKDDVEDLGLIKLDLLCLRMLSAVEDTVQAVRTQDPGFDYDRLPPTDPEVYRLIAAADTPGVFQLESPAQRALHTRLQPRTFEDLVASVALIRPGPIAANMVRPYIARRNGEEPITYLHPALERILRKTYGVVLFQEQVIEIATEIAGFSPGEADQLRRAMTHQRSWEAMERLGDQFIGRAIERGVAEPIAREIFSYVRAYAGYGFCEAHAAAFADTGYKTAYLKVHHAAEFYAALLSRQPMGFYPPNTLVWDAKRRGIEVLGPDINRSGAHFAVEDGAIRTSLAQIRGVGEAALLPLLEERQRGGPFRSLSDFCRRARLRRDVAVDMILCGAFDALDPHRRRLLWELDRVWQEDDPEPQLDLGEGCGPAVGRGPVPRPSEPASVPCDAERSEASARWPTAETLRFAQGDTGGAPPVGRGFHAPPTPARGGTRALQNGAEGRATESAPYSNGPEAGRAQSPPHADPEGLPDFTVEEKWWQEFHILGITPGRHPMELLRGELGRRGIPPIAEASRAPAGRTVRTAGVVIRPHRPPTKSGRTVVFLTLEDETGLLDVTIFESVYQRCGRAIFAEPVVIVTGQLDRRHPDASSAALIARSVEPCPVRRATDLGSSVPQHPAGTR